MLGKLLPDPAAYFTPPGGPSVDFTQPAGAPALFAPNSLTWRLMKNPVALVVGGIAAVILELAEPRVRTGVWEHTSFRRDPLKRMRRTGYAAMVTVYAPADAARPMIAGVVRAHERVEGVTPAGAPYRANDPELLKWVHATAAFGFCEAYHRFVLSLSPEQRDAYYAEGASAAALYGVTRAPGSERDLEALFAATRAKLERSAIVHEFLSIVRGGDILPSRALQRLVVRGAVEITPAWAREILGLGPEFGLRPGYGTLLRTLGRVAERTVLESAPPAQACRRLGLPADYLYR